MPISPTAEGFRTAFRHPSLALGEIAWRWTVGATATALFFFGLFEYLDTLPVTSGELLFLRTRQPYLVAQALAHILRGSLSRALMAALLAGVMVSVLGVVAASLGRIATARGLLEYFREQARSKVSAREVNVDFLSQASPFRTLARLNLLRQAVALAALCAFVGAAILAGFASPDNDPNPGLAFLLFLPPVGLICLVWWALNWLLSLAGLFAVRNGEDAVGAISVAVTFCRERTGAVFAVSTWTGLAHLVAFVGATTVVSMPLGFAGVLPWRLVVLGVVFVTLIYFALADWLYMARLAGYVCIAETPEELLASLPPNPMPAPPPGGLQVTSRPPVQTTIDRDEPILSDVPGVLPASL